MKQRLVIAALLLVALLGLLVMATAFLFYASNGIPFQDATAEQLAHQASQSKKYIVIMLLGLLASVFAIYSVVKQKRKLNKH